MMKRIRLAGSALVVLMGGIMIGPSGLANAQADMSYRWGSYSITTQNTNGHEEDNPTSIGNLSGVASIEAANSSDLFLLSDGAVETVGDNAFGNLGNGTTANSPNNAVSVSLPWIATAIGEADNTDTATNGAGDTEGWGENGFGQLCLGNMTEENSPTDITSLAGDEITAMAGGGTHILYQTGPDSLLACGGNQYGELGDGTFTSSTMPVSVDTTVWGSNTIVAISAARSTSAALLSNGTVWTWGMGKFGELGDGSTANSDVPVQVNLGAGVTATEIYAGGDTTKDGQMVALTSAGPMAWGFNANGELDNGNTINQDTPVGMNLLPTLTDGETWTYVATGGENTLALTSLGNIWSSGNDSHGQVGDGNSSGNVLTPVLVDTGVDAISTTADDVVVHTP